MPILMTVYPWLIPIYADGIYIYGNRRFTARESFLGIPVTYHEAVKQYAATTYTLLQINNALAQSWINQQEYDETIAYIPV